MTTTVLSNILNSFPGAKPYLSDYFNASNQYNVPVSVLMSQGQAESNFNPSAVSSAGAIGISQFMPATASQFGINPLNPAQSISAQAKYLSQLTSQFGSLNSGLQAYNEGPSAFAQNGGTTQTQAYASGILKNAGLNSNGSYTPPSNLTNSNVTTKSSCSYFDIFCYFKEIAGYFVNFQSDMIFFIVGLVIVILTVATLIFNSDAVKTSVSTATKIAKLAK